MSEIPENIQNQMLKEFERLLKYYQNGNYNEAKELASSLTEKFPNQPFPWKILGVLFKQMGREHEALYANQKAIEFDPQDIESHINLGVILNKLGRYKDAEINYRKVISLKPNFAEAHNNLGNTLKEMGKLKESQTSFMEAISLKPNFAEAHNNLGNTLKEMGKLKESQTSFMEAISLKPDLTEAYTNLGSVFYIDGNIDSAIEEFEKANHLNPNLKINELLLKVSQAKKLGKQKSKNIDDVGYKLRVDSSPLILKRKVESDLIPALYKMDYRELEKTPDTRFGNGRCSPNYNMFKEDHSAVKNVANDLIRIIESAVNSKIHVFDSFFNIYSTGAGITAHDHITKIDRDKNFNLANKKYSLVYYLSVGDQDCSKPGVLKLYDPEYKILPSEGMIVIFPADRKHSSVYDGKIDRVLIGINFYCL